MKKIILSVIIFSCLLVKPAVANHVDEGDAAKNLIKVEKSYGQENEDSFKEVVEKAKKYAEEHYVENAAIVSDVDETVLDNREYYSIYGVYTKENWAKWIDESKDKELKPTCEFLKWAKDKGYKIFFITGRTKLHKEATLKNLAEYDIQYDEIFFKPEDYNEPSASVYKTSVRKKLTDEGYKIIVNIGDQKSDIEGGYGKGFKLPNDFYTVP